MMKRQEFESLCRAVEAGESRFLENRQSHHAGRATGCRGEQVDIDIFGKRETWEREECKEVHPDFNFHE